MSQNLKGITFGFFESLPEDAKFYIEDILYGSKASKAKPELPWEDEVEECTAVPSVPVEELEEPVCVDNAPVEVSVCTNKESVEVSVYSDNVPLDVTPLVDSVAVECDHAVQNSPDQADLQFLSEGICNFEDNKPLIGVDLVPGGGDGSPGSDMTLPSPPGIHQPLFHIPVVTGIPPHIMVGVYHHQSVPINYMPMIPHQGIAMIPPPQDLMINTVLPEDHQIHRDQEEMYNNNDMFKENKDKMPGGKTYERRNKKRRPANYYENLERRQVPQSMESIQMYNSNMAIVSPPYPPPGHIAHFSPQHHHAEPVHSEYGGHPAVFTNVLTSNAGHCTQYAGHIPTFMPQCAPPLGPMPAEAIVMTSGLPQQHTDTCNDVQPDIPPAECTHTTNTSLSSEIYSDDSRTQNRISLEEVREEIIAIDQQENYMENREKNIENAEQEVDHSEQKVDIVEKNVDNSVVFELSDTKDVPADVVPFCDTSSPCDVEISPPEVGPTHDLRLQTVSDSSVTVTLELPSVVSVGSKPEVTSSDDASPPPPCAHLPECDPEPSQVHPTECSDATKTPNQNNNALPESELKSNENVPSSPPDTGAQAVTKTTSWASLFRSTTTAAAATVIYNQSRGPVSEDKIPTKKDMEKLPETTVADKDKVVHQLGAMLNDYSISYKSMALQPRGLTNRSNWCYVNSTLQALLACPAFYNLIKYLPSYPALVRGPSSTPILDSIVKFVNEFSPMPPIKPMEKGNKGKGNIKYDLPTGPTFEATYVFKMLQVIKYDGFKGGRQEDAEEFLGCLLNGIHEEMVAAMKIDQARNSDSTNELDEVTTNGNGELPLEDLSQDVEVDDAGWEQVGPKNKSVVTRTATIDKSPVSDIFQGQIRNILNRPGMRESATLQPFFTLQLEIQSDNVHTVQEALDNLVSKEMLQDFTCSKTKQEVDASRRTMLEQLPPVLVLHFKCFVYDKNGGCQKVVKQLDFSSVLEIHKDLLSPTARGHFPVSQRKYKLFAVLKHVGVRAAGGHYVADVYHKHLGEWVHYDDNNVHVVTMAQVFMFRHPRVPYLLFYRRDDLR